MKRRHLIKSMAALPVGAAACMSALPFITHRTAEETRTGTAVAADPAAAHPRLQPPLRLASLVNLRPGQLSLLMGRPANGKTTLALSIAMEAIEAGDGEVWYFSSANAWSEKTAAMLGLQVRLLNTPPETDRHMYGDRAYRAYVGEQALPLIFFDIRMPGGEELRFLPRRVAAMATSTPGLVIFDQDDVDVTTLDPRLEHAMAAELVARSEECGQLFNAPVLATFGTSSDADLPIANNRTPLADPKARREHPPITAEVYFVHRPKLYSDAVGHSGPDVIELSSKSRGAPASHIASLLHDPQSGRLHGTPSDTA